MVPYDPGGPASSRMVPYGSVWTCMAPYGPVGSSLVQSGPIWSHMVLYGPLWSSIVLFGPVWSRAVPYGPVWLRISAYTDTGQSSDPSGSVEPNRFPTGFRQNPVLARRDPTRLDGSLDCPVSMHDGCTDPYGTPRRPHGPSGAPSGPNGPPADPRRHHRSPFNRSLPGLGGPQLLLAQPMLLGIAHIANQPPAGPPGGRYWYLLESSTASVKSVA